MKVVPQAANCAEIQVGNRIYRRNKKGLFNMPDRVAEHVIKNEGGQATALSGISHTKDGYRCVDCGFGSWFVKCSKCGGECRRAE